MHWKLDFIMVIVLLVGSLFVQGGPQHVLADEGGEEQLLTKIALLESLLDRQNERVGTLWRERKQLVQEKANLNAKVADLSLQVANLSLQIESMEKERSNPSWKSDRQEREIATLSKFLVRLTTDQKGNPYRMVPVCFTSSDQHPCSEDLILEINMAMSEVQAWYYSYVGKTFEWNPVVTMQGQQPLAWYDIPEKIYDGNLRGGAWTRVVPEVADRLPQADGDFVYLVFLKGLKNSVALAAGSDYSSGLRFGFFGNTTISNLSYKTPEGRQLAVGTISHEIGHALGIYIHSLLPNTILGNSADIFGGFSEEELKVLKESPFLR